MTSRKTSKDPLSAINDKLDRLDKKIDASEKRILGEMGRFVSDEILPQIDKKADKTDIDRVERKLDYFGARTMENTTRLDTIESLPTVAHELKLQKKH